MATKPGINLKLSAVGAVSAVEELSEKRRNRGDDPQQTQLHHKYNDVKKLEDRVTARDADAKNYISFIAAFPHTLYNVDDRGF